MAVTGSSSTSRARKAPKAALILQLGEGEFLLAGLNFKAVPQPKTSDSGFVDVLSITEGRYEKGLWVPGRRLNGDEFRVVLGSHPALLRVCLGHRK